MMRLLPSGVAGLVFAALIAAIVASTASKINSIATIFTLDIYNKFGGPKEEQHLVTVGRITAVVAIALAIATARPLLGSFDQAFQYIQEYTGFFTPGIVVIFLLGLFWKKATEAAALWATVASFGLSIALKGLWPELPFMDRMALVFVLALGLAIAVSLLQRQAESSNRIDMERLTFTTSRRFNVGAAGVVMVLVALYSAWW
jgi:SSS family solute:Na+ symporter